jgi:hypothetical protein
MVFTTALYRYFKVRRAVTRRVASIVDFADEVYCAVSGARRVKGAPGRPLAATSAPGSRRKARIAKAQQQSAALSSAVVQPSPGAAGGGRKQAAQAKRMKALEEEIAALKQAAALVQPLKHETTRSDDGVCFFEDVSTPNESIEARRQQQGHGQENSPPRTVAKRAHTNSGRWNQLISDSTVGEEVQVYDIVKPKSKNPAALRTTVGYTHQQQQQEQSVSASPGTVSASSCGESATAEGIAVALIERFGAR